MCSPTPQVVEAFKSLGLTPMATREEAVKKYRQLALKAHPDRNGGTAEFQALGKVYDVVKEYFDAQGISRSPIFDDASISIIAQGLRRAFRRTNSPISRPSRPSQEPTVAEGLRWAFRRTDSPISRPSSPSQEPIFAEGLRRAFRRTDSPISRPSRPSQEPRVNASTMQLRQEQLLLRGKKFCIRTQSASLRIKLDQEIAELQKSYDNKMETLRTQIKLIKTVKSEVKKKYENGLREIRQAERNLESNYSHHTHSFYSTVEIGYREGKDLLSRERARLNDLFEEKNREIKDHEQYLDECKKTLLNIFDMEKKDCIDAYNEDVRILENSLEREQDELCELMFLSSSDDRSQARKNELLKTHVEWMNQYNVEICEEQRKFIDESIAKKKNMSMEADQIFQRSVRSLSDETTRKINEKHLGQRRELEELYQNTLPKMEFSEDLLYVRSLLFQLHKEQRENTLFKRILCIALCSIGCVVSAFIVKGLKKLNVGNSKILPQDSDLGKVMAIAQKDDHKCNNVIHEQVLSQDSNINNIVEENGYKCNAVAPILNSSIKKSSRIWYICILSAAVFALIARIFLPRLGLKITAFQLKMRK